MTIAQTHGFSPDSSSPELTSGAYDDDNKDTLFPDEEFVLSDSLATGPVGGTGKKGNGRKGPQHVDKRANHNAIERARRESLNGRFMTLAEALPAMANVKRPSKSIIVNKALDFVFDAQVTEHLLVRENNSLRHEVDQLRARLGMPPLPPPAPLPVHSSKNTSPASVKLSSPFAFQSSFSSSDGFQDDISGTAHSLYSNAAAAVKEQTSPASSHSQSHSPGSSVHPSVLSVGSHPSPPISPTAGSPAYAHPQFVNGELTLSPGIEELDSVSRRMSLNNGAPSPFLPNSSGGNVNSSMMYTHGSLQQQQQSQHIPTYSPAQLSQNQQFAYGMNPALQHQMMMELQLQQNAHLQQQQIQHHQQMPQHAYNQIDTGMFGLNGGLNWNGFGAGIGVDGGMGGDVAGFGYMV